jgi:hypothetical protein
MMTAGLKEKKRKTMRRRMVKRESTNLRSTMMIRTMRTMMMTTTKGTKHVAPIGKKVNSQMRGKQ